MNLGLANLHNRNVLVTGASQGIGRLCAIHAARRGARVALVARGIDEALDDVAAVIADEGGIGRAYACDVANRDAVTSTLGCISADIGPIDVAILCAGIGGHHTFIGQPISDIDHMFAVNVFGVINVAHPLALEMATRGAGHLLIMASVAGLVAVPGESVYAATKHALVGLAESMAIELAPHGVQVVTLCPGAVDTNFHDDPELIPAAGKRLMVDPHEVVQSVFRALRRGTSHRVVVPKSLGVAVAFEGIAPKLMQRGTARATRRTLDKIENRDTNTPRR